MAYNGQTVMQQRLPTSAATLELGKGATVWHPHAGNVVPPLPPLPPPSTFTEDELLPWEAMIKSI